MYKQCENNLILTDTADTIPFSTQANWNTRSFFTFFFSVACSNLKINICIIISIISSWKLIHMQTAVKVKMLWEFHKILKINSLTEKILGKNCDKNCEILSWGHYLLSDLKKVGDFFKFVYLLTISELSYNSHHHFHYYTVCFETWSQ